LDAEQIRDLALSASGLLSNKVGGPPVKPYQPDGIWEAVAMPQSNTKNYVKDRGESLYRRSLYTMWKRTAPPPSMEILNAPSRESFCVRRDRTNTPLQALVLLNDPQFVEASRELAAVAIRHASDINERLDWITLRLCSRVFDEKEREIVRRSYDATLAEYRKHPELATQLVSTGETPYPKDLDVSELAASTLVTSQILNLDETITR
jgi:predicted DNA-binding protein (MmcQ/YjbR family)